MKPSGPPSSVSSPVDESSMPVPEDILQQGKALQKVGTPFVTSIAVQKPRDLDKIVNIRGEPHSVILAIHRQIDHYGYHVGQIVQTARILAQNKWTTLSIPRGGSEEFNRRTWQSGPDNKVMKPTC